MTSAVKSRVPAEEPAEMMTRSFDSTASTRVSRISRGIIGHDGVLRAGGPHLREKYLRHDGVALHNLAGPGADAEGDQLASRGDDPDPHRSGLPSA